MTVLTDSVQLMLNPAPVNFILGYYLRHAMQCNKPNIIIYPPLQWSHQRWLMSGSVNIEAVNVKTFGLLPDRAWIWLDFPDFKHDSIKEVYQSDVSFAGHGPQTRDFHSDW